MCQIFCLAKTDPQVPFLYHFNVMLHATYWTLVAALSLNPSRFPVTLPTDVYSVFLICLNQGAILTDIPGQLWTKHPIGLELTGAKKQRWPLRTNIQAYSPHFHLGGLDVRATHVTLRVNLDLPNKPQHHFCRCICRLVHSCGSSYWISQNIELTSYLSPSIFTLHSMALMLGITLP